MIKKLFLFFSVLLLVVVAGCVDFNSSSNKVSSNAESSFKSSSTTPPVYYANMKEFEWYKMPCDMHSLNYDEIKKIEVFLDDDFRGPKIVYVKNYTGESYKLSDKDISRVVGVDVYYSDTYMVSYAPFFPPAIPLTMTKRDNKSIYLYYINESYDALNRGCYDEADTYAHAALLYMKTREAYMLRAECAERQGDERAKQYFLEKAQTIPN